MVPVQLAYFSNPRLARSQKVSGQISSEYSPTPVMSTRKATISANKPPEKLAKNNMLPRVIPVARPPGGFVRLCCTTGDKPSSNTCVALCYRNSEHNQCAGSLQVTNG